MPKIKAIYFFHRIYHYLAKKNEKSKWPMKLGVDFMKQKRPFFQGACMKPIACGQKCLDSFTGIVWMHGIVNGSEFLVDSLCRWLCQNPREYWVDWKYKGSVSSFHIGKLSAFHQVINKKSILCIISFGWPFTFSNRFN